MEKMESEDASDVASSSFSWVRDVRVVGVMHLDKCMKCKTKLVPDGEDPELGHCSKCEMVRCLDGGNKGLMAKLMVASGAEKLTLCAFAKIIENIAEKPGDEVVIGALLKSKPFKIIHVDGIIQSISRKP